MQLSPHFQLAEFLYSQTAIENHIINDINEHYIIDNLQILCFAYLEPIRKLLENPIEITSGYRCKELNKIVGGSDTSQHMTGEAADITPAGEGEHVPGAKHLFDLIVEGVISGKLKVPNQLIYYPSKNIVHIAHLKNPKGEYWIDGQAKSVFKTQNDQVLENIREKYWTDRTEERLSFLESMIERIEEELARRKYNLFPNKRE